MEAAFASKGTGFKQGTSTTTISVNYINRFSHARHGLIKSEQRWFISRHPAKQKAIPRVQSAHHTVPGGGKRS
eukprot:4804958-Pleurochrysis_carterae.AAC.2